MYTRAQSYTAVNDISPARFIESISDISDLANSTLLYMIDNESIRKEWTITKYERRWDMISTEIYGNEKYSWLLQYMNRLPVNQLVRGTKITYIPIGTLEEILYSIV